MFSLQICRTYVDLNILLISTLEHELYFEADMSDQIVYTVWANFCLLSCAHGVSRMRMDIG